MEIVEADDCVDSVPVEHPVLKKGRLLQLAVDLLFVEDVEECLEED